MLAVGLEDDRAALIVVAAAVNVGGHFARGAEGAVGRTGAGVTRHPEVQVFAVVAGGVKTVAAVGVGYISAPATTILSSVWTAIARPVVTWATRRRRCRRCRRWCPVRRCRCSGPSQIVLARLWCLPPRRSCRTPERRPRRPDPLLGLDRSGDFATGAKARVHYTVAVIAHQGEITQFAAVLNRPDHEASIVGRMSMAFPSAVVKFATELVKLVVTLPLVPKVVSTVPSLL